MFLKFLVRKRWCISCSPAFIFFLGWLYHFSFPLRFNCQCNLIWHYIISSWVMTVCRQRRGTLRYSVISCTWLRLLLTRKGLMMGLELWSMMGQTDVCFISISFEFDGLFKWFTDQLIVFYRSISLSSSHSSYWWATDELAPRLIWIFWLSS